MSYNNKYIQLVYYKMFGFSLPKLILLLVLILIIWQVFKIIEKRQKGQGIDENNGEEINKDYESLIECKKCGIFFSKDKTKSCPLCNK